MAFVVKNNSGQMGSAKIKDEWESVPPGTSLRVSEKPSSHSYNVKVFQVPDAETKPIKKVSPAAPVDAQKSSALGEGASNG